MFLNNKMEAILRCNFGGGGGAKPPPPPPPPSPTSAEENLRNREADRRRIMARGYQSTILSGDQGPVKKGKSLLGE